MIMESNQGRLKSLLQQESSTLEDLYETLMKELIALKERDADSVTLLSQEKNTLLNELQKLDTERQLYLQSSFSKASAGVTDEINQLTNEIEACLKKCKKQNSINGGIIEMSKLFNEKMLDIICGNADKETTYGSTGKNNTDKNQHSLGRV